MAFYAGIITQSAKDRPFTEAYDNWNGSLKYQGIYADKVYASQYLLGSDGLPFNPNEGPFLTSFSELLDSPNAELKQMSRAVLEKIYTETGDGYVGFSTLVRSYAISGTVFRKGSDTAYEATRYGCYTANSLKSQFGIEVSTFQDKDLQVIEDMTAVKDPYYSTQSKVALLKVDGRFYVAGADSNFLAYALLNKSELDASDRSDIRELYSGFYLYSEGRAAECQ
ncbi:MAG TPA: hypothetical protein VE954_11290 [Oligoflexus sp.]|uniref:hypothetical protein n=1 Tax=Oligoflexus sp. TaxID=1971216 RepID=UPI002D6AAA9C|nr:hypothetical protein [Oligoflexus sp.]HYX33688.1 hypothetical protein [Oligoflexus sp.]